MMIIILSSNVIEIGSILYRLITWCPEDGYNSIQFGICDFINRIRYVSYYTIIFIIGIPCLISTTLHFLNLVICYKNFGKNLGFYCKCTVHNIFEKKILIFIKIYYYFLVK